MNKTTEQIKAEGRVSVPVRRSRPRLRILIAGTAAITMLGWGIMRLSTGSDVKAADQAPLPSVVVSNPLTHEIAPRIEFLGQMTAVEDVELRAQVGGTLAGIRFKDGEVVHKGEALFEIDRTPYEIKLAQATAQLESAKARMTLATRQLARATELKSTDAGSVENVDQANAEKLAAQAAVDAGNALVRDAKFDLDHCTITAPFAGRMGTHLVSVGNLIAGSRTGGSANTLLARIVSLDPIYVNFDMSENDYLLFLRQRRDQALGNQVAIALDGESTFARTGTLTFIDNTLDHSSGTIHARATLANPDSMLTPGGYARVRLMLAHNVPVLLVPDASVIADQSDHVVMVVGAGDVVAMKKVEVGDLRGGLRVIRSGLAPDDRVIIGGLPAASVGSKVATSPGVIRFDASQDKG